MEHKSLAEGGPRVKFNSHWKGTLQSFLDGLSEDVQASFHMELLIMTEALLALEETGASPVLPDGKIGGNAAFRLKIDDGSDVIVLSKSGKTAGEKFDLNSVCIVTNFNESKWASEYYSAAEDVLPTSDTPMHFAALHAHEKLKWSEHPNAVLHGHALESEAEANRLGLPISTEETLFSTPEDTQALVTLLESDPYPNDKIFIRKGHGFLLLGKSMNEALDTFRKCIVPNIKHSK